MRRGSAREPSNPVALVLGGTVPHRELLRNLRSRGFATVLIDYLESPPAASLADIHVRESALDEDAVLRCALERGASLVISTCVDQANLIACRVAHRLGLPIPYSLETAQQVTNKALMKNRLKACGIPTSPFIAGTSWEHFEGHQLRFPLVVKPADSNGSKGVVKVERPENLKGAVEAALRISRSRQAIVEEWLDGREIAFDSFILDGQAQFLLSRERRKIRHLDDSNEVQQIVGSIWPAQIADGNAAGLERLAEQVAAAFELENTPLMIQSILHEGSFKVIEFAPRIGGAENYRIVPIATDLDIIDCAVDSWIGNRPQLRHRHPRHVLADLYLYAKPAPFGSVEGTSGLVEGGVALYGETYKRAGEDVGTNLTSFQRVGAIVVRGSTEQDALRRLQKVAESVRVLDTSGRDITRHDLLQASLEGLDADSGP